MSGLSTQKNRKNKRDINSASELLLIAIAASALVAASCNSVTNTNKADEHAISAGGTTQSSDELFGITGEEILIREAPGETSKKLINAKATLVLGKTQYCQVDYSV